MGASGAGKTVLLNILSGRLNPDGLEGEVLVDGVPRFTPLSSLPSLPDFFSLFLSLSLSLSSLPLAVFLCLHAKAPLVPPLFSALKPLFDPPCLPLSLPFLAFLVVSPPCSSLSLSLAVSLRASPEPPLVPFFVDFLYWLLSLPLSHAVVVVATAAAVVVLVAVVVVLAWTPRPANWVRISKYVSASDDLIPTMTVREQLRFAAELQLPSTFTGKEKDLVVSYTIRALGLDTCADTKVGGGLIRGISGGQRRRTILGIELLCQPRLFLVVVSARSLFWFTSFSSFIFPCGGRTHEVESKNAQLTPEEKRARSAFLSETKKHALGT